jgi:hypothetical protein
LNIDWENWKPGDSDAQEIAARKGWLREGLSRQGIVFPGMEEVHLDELAAIVSAALGQGSAEAKVVKEVVTQMGVEKTLAKSLVHFATALAQSQRSLSSYFELPDMKVEWDSSGCCDICDKNDNHPVKAGENFPSGHQLPPACEYCICAIMPFFED